MSKVKLSMEQIVAGALLLNFESMSSIDISLLTEDFLKKNPDYKFTSDDFSYLNKYIQSENEIISLRTGLTMNTYVPENRSNLRKRLGQIAGARIRKYLETFDMEEFMLRKIKYYSGAVIPNLCQNEQDELNKLNAKGYLTISGDGDSKVISLSSSGMLRLFKIDYTEEIERFSETLKSLRYAPSLLDEFLINQDLRLPVSTILNIKNFEQFLNNYSGTTLEAGVSEVSFERLTRGSESIFDESSKQVIQNMLSVWDDGHCVYICHPNHIFDGAKLITKDVRDIRNVNWDDIDIEKMFRINDYKTFVSPDCGEAFKYVHNRLGNQIMQEVKKGNREAAVSYLAIVEKYCLDYENYYLVRGIIKGDSNGYSIVFNPEYQKVIPESIWDKSLRLCGHGVPEAYCVKRKKLQMN